MLARIMRPVITTEAQMPATPAEQPPEPHPTRQVPLCTECAFRGYGPYHDRCNHPAAPVDVVDGAPLIRLTAMRGGLASPAELAVSRDQSTYCGRNGTLFTPRRAA